MTTKPTTTKAPDEVRLAVEAERKRILEIVDEFDGRSMRVMTLREHLHIVLAEEPDAS